MTTKARIWQAILFETIAILLSLGWVKLLSFFGFTGSESQHNSNILALLIGISLIAMIWTLFITYCLINFLPVKNWLVRYGYGYCI